MFKVGDKVVFINDKPVTVNGRVYTLNKSTMIVNRMYTIIEISSGSELIKVTGEKNFTFIERFVSLDDYKLMQINYRKQKILKIKKCVK